MAEQSTFVDSLRCHLAGEIAKAVGLRATGWYRGLIDRLFRTPTQRFAQIAADFDEWVSRSGFAAAAREILPRFVLGFRAHGVEHVPANGPLLVTSNHPGTVDALVVAACLGRDDLKIVSSDIPFLRHLPSASKHLLFASRDTHARSTVLRSAIRHLSSGGALLIFPSGHLDPDPEVLPGGQETLSEWSASIRLMLRRAAQARVLVTVVSGVLARGCAHSPLTWLRRRPIDRQRIGEFVQVIEQMLFGHRFALNPRVSFSEPVTMSELCALAGSTEVMEAITRRARGVFSDHMALGPRAIGSESSV